MPNAAYKSNYYAENRDQLLADSRRRYHTPEGKAAKQRRNFTPERLARAKERARLYYIEHKEDLKAKMREAYRLDVAKMLHRSARNRAKYKGLDFTITKEDVVIPDVCPILGIPLSIAEGTMQPYSPSLDRKDNSKGYTPDNVWVISSLANTMKSSASIEQLAAFGKWCYDTHFNAQRRSAAA